MCICEFCNVRCVYMCEFCLICLCRCGFFIVYVCIILGSVMCRCEDVFVCVCVVFVMCSFCVGVWLCFQLCRCVYMWVI